MSGGILKEWRGVEVKVGRSFGVEHRSMSLFCKGLRECSKVGFEMLQYDTN